MRAFYIFKWWGNYSLLHQLKAVYKMLRRFRKQHMHNTSWTICTPFRLASFANWCPLLHDLQQDCTKDVMWKEKGKDVVVSYTTLKLRRNDVKLFGKWRKQPRSNFHLNSNVYTLNDFIHIQIFKSFVVRFCIKI